jgi:phosphoserine phosphatase RsbU/P
MTHQDKRPALRICFVDDDEDYYVIIRDLLKESASFDCTLTWCSTFEAGVAEIGSTPCDVFLFDYRLGEKNGLDLLRTVIGRGIRTPVIMLTGQGDREIDMEAMKIGAADYLVKGEVSASLLERSIRYALEHFRTLEQLRASRDSLHATTRELERALSSINEELETAKRVQKSLLPQNLDAIAGLDLCASYLPSGLIGGDMYDVLRTDDSHTAFLVLDVCGHGVPAALITAMAKISFTRCLLKYDSPKEIFSQVNAELCRFMPESRYVTAFCAVLDMTRKSLAFSRAGHPPAAHYRASAGIVDYLLTPAPLIGCFPDSTFEESSVAVGTNDVIVFYTDGLVESQNKRGMRFDMKEFENMLARTAHLSAKDITAALVGMLATFTAGTPQADDVTVMVVKIV